MILYELKQPKNSGTVPLRLDSKTGALLVSGALKKGRLAVFVEASDQVKCKCSIIRVLCIHNNYYYYCFDYLACKSIRTSIFISCCHS